MRWRQSSKNIQLGLLRLKNLVSSVCSSFDCIRKISMFLSHLIQWYEISNGNYNSTIRVNNPFPRHDLLRNSCISEIVTNSAKKQRTEKGRKEN